MYRQDWFLLGIFMVLLSICLYLLYQSMSLPGMVEWIIVLLPVVAVAAVIYGVCRGE